MYCSNWQFGNVSLVALPVRRGGNGRGDENDWWGKEKCDVLAPTSYLLRKNTRTVVKQFNDLTRFISARSLRFLLKLLEITIEDS